MSGMHHYETKDMLCYMSSSFISCLAGYGAFSHEFKAR
jgi:hypothetical protein